MNKDTVQLFGAGFIEIKDGAGGDLTDHFIEPVYTDLGDSHYAVINPNGANLPPFDTVIRVYVGENLKNIQGNEMANNAMSFSFRTITASSENPEITSWNAVYDENTASGWIDLSYTSNGGTHTEAVYRENRASPNEVENYRITTGKLNANAVRLGTEVNGIREYEITIRVFEGQAPADVVTFRIWNVPGMTTNSNEQIAIINDQALQGSEAMGNEQIREVFADAAISNIVLTSNITLSDWEPVDFSGKNFYGNGHTVTIKSFNSSYMGAAVDGGDLGLFGAVGEGAIIRDLTVFYEKTTNMKDEVDVTLTDSMQFGGIVGTLSGNAQLINVLVKGAVSIDGSNGASETNFVSVGGLVGTMADTSNIHNAYGGLNLSVEHSGATSTTGAGNSINIGGIAGITGEGTITEISVVGDISVGRKKEVNTMNAALNTHFGLVVGGLVGVLFNTRLEDADYSQGSLLVRSGQGAIYAGGALGKTSGTAYVEDCIFFGSSFVVNKTNTGSIFYVGGFVGDFYGGTAINCSSANPVTITMETAATGSVNAGGFSARINANISYCYAKGDISVNGFGPILAGGFTSTTYNSSTNFIRNCYATGDVNIISQSFFVALAGGFVAELFMILEDCYATGNVTVTKPNAASFGTINAGGLVGNIPFSNNNGSINRCFATGTVTVHLNGSSGTTNAGGLVGSEYSTTFVASRKTISNSAALGQSVTITGGATRDIGRIYGFGYTDNKFNNRALIDMQLYQHATYLFSNPSAETISSAHDDKDGQDASDLNFRRIDIWRNTAPAAGTAPGTLNGLGFSDTNWDFSTVQTRGYPILRGVNGVGLLGGQ